MTPNLRAMLWMLANATAIASMAAIFKHVASELPVTVVVLWRMVFTLILFLPLMVKDWRRLVFTERLGLHLVRGFVGVLSLALYVYGLRELSLMDAVVLVYTRPLWMIVIALMLLGERIGLSRSLATVMGFGGVVVMVDPRGGVEPAMLVVLAAAIVACFVIVTMKKLTTTEPVPRIVFYFAVTGSVFLLPFAITEGATPTLIQFLWLGASALVGTIGIYAMSRACEIGDASVVTPIDFAQLPVAAVLGFVVFAELPGPATVLGAAIIVLATLWIARSAGGCRSTA